MLASNERDAWVERLASAGAQCWPTITLAHGDLQRALSRWPDVLGARVGDPAEVFLALACIDGRAPAMPAFERRYVAPAERALARRGLDADDLAEIRQRVRIRLFVHERAGAPVVLHYAGGGRLAGLVRVVLVREAVRYESTPTPAELDLATIGGEDPERTIVGRQQQALAKAAFERAAASLAQRDRYLLRLHYARGTSGARIATMYGVNRATVSRWIEAARLRLLAQFSRELRALAPGLTAAQRERFDAWFSTHVELSLSRVLATHA